MLLDDDAIVIPTPAYLPPGTQPRDDHARWVIEQAASQDDQGLPYVWDPAVIIKNRATRKLKSLGGSDRRVERDAIRDSLLVPDPRRVRRRAVWIYDDVFTTGSTLDAVAEVLKVAGASSVYGLVLSRQPYR